MGNYVSVMGHAWPASLVSEIRVKLSADQSTEILSADLLEAIWSISAQAHKQIRQKLDMKLKDDIVGIMKFVPDWRKQVMDAARRPREYSYFISNIGAIDGGLQTDTTASEAQSERWTINRAQFSMSTEVTSAPLMTSAMSVVGGPLCVGITWQDGVLDDSMGEAFAAELESWLVQIGRVSP